jgi:hypothetical protein
MRRIVTMSCMLATVLLAGCGSDGSTAPITPIAPTPQEFEGTWILSTVDGKLPPHLQAQDGGNEFWLVTSRLTIGPDGRFTQESTVRWTQPSGQTGEPAPWSNGGDYTLVGTTATFRGSFYNVLSVTTVSTSTITATAEGHTWLFRKL